MRVLRSTTKLVLSVLLLLAATAAMASPASAAESRTTKNADGTYTIEYSPEEAEKLFAREHGSPLGAQRLMGSNPCGSGYTHSGGAQRITDSGGVPIVTAYSWYKDIPDNGFYEDPTCGLLYSEGNYSGKSMYLSATLCDNYVDTPCATDAGYYATYAGPVRQTHGYCGKYYFFMKKTKTSSDLARGSFTVGACN
ncbi:hypothetical protein [Streptomyces chattanoogensis]|uniref:Uncharacterized protein n=1 Tax=Streptomyces chattanoogensis TaxID=66876 RepID=A0A0N0GZI4_9ACTN|nr:hypothetical protein [Streptomyces chattanoogensis]KPC62520.1 hypothetical protein ADL29_18525 [Streptomyces chattanoogensis]